MTGTAWITDGNAAISAQALRAACALLAAGETSVQHCLYNYGRLPLSPAWMHRFPLEMLVEDALTQAHFGSAHPVLHPCWHEQPPPADNPRWRFFNNACASAAHRGAAPFKIYVNLHPQALAARFGVIAECMRQFDVAAFKVPRDLFNLLRADKLIIYIHDMAVQRALSLHLASLLQNDAVQALPFTGAVGSSGAVSCGFDPPARVMAQLNATSWRAWISKECATILRDGFAQQIRGEELVVYACNQLERRGVDTDRWVPKVIA